MSWVPLIIGVLAIFTHLLFKRVGKPVAGRPAATIRARTEPATLSLNFLFVVGGIPAVTVLGGTVWMIVLLHRRGQLIPPLSWVMIMGSLLLIGALGVAYVRRNRSASYRQKPTMMRSTTRSHPPSSISRLVAMASVRQNNRLG